MKNYTEAELIELFEKQFGKIVDGEYRGYLDLRGYQHPLPSGFTHCAGWLDLEGYQHPLPSGFTHCAGWLDLRGYAHPLPSRFTHCAGSLDLEGYQHPLPSGFTHCDGSLDLEGYQHPLPSGFTHCAGWLVLEGYQHPLPSGFTHCAGSLDLEGYQHPLPSGFTHCAGIYSNSGTHFAHASYPDAQFINVDGTIVMVESRKTAGDVTIIRGGIVNHIKDGKLVLTDCYVAMQGEYSAHGKTAKEAVSDLQFKIMQEKMANEPISMDSMISIARYRAITGACKLGIANWMKQNGIAADEMRVSELLPMLEKTNAYGLDKLKSLINT